MIYVFNSLGQLEPAQAMSASGVYLENVVDGYRTLKVTGREPLDMALTTIDVGTADGARYVRRRIKSRTITIDYALAAEGPWQFAERYNALRAALHNIEESQIVFADEPDKYFVGTFEKISVSRVGQGAYTGTVTILCSDPFKYSLDERTVDFAGGTAEIYYSGTEPAYPSFSAYLPSTNGFVSFSKEQATLVFGDDTDEGDEEQEEEYIPDPDALVEYAFSDGMPSGTNWVQNDGVLPYVVSPTAAGGTLAITDDGALRGDTFGTNNNKWHGPTLSYHLDGSKTECELSFYHINEATANGQCGMLQVSLTSASGNVAAVSFWKNGTGSKNGGYDMYVNGSRKKSVSYSMAAGNAISGSKGGRTIISKKGSVITFNVSGTTYQYTDSSLEDVAVIYFTFYLAKWNAATMLNKNKVWSFRFTSPDESSGSETPVVVEHAFHAGDVLDIDTASADTRLNGITKHELGEVRNPWESMALTPGLNIITMDSSEWADGDPTATITYREVFA